MMWAEFEEIAGYEVSFEDYEKYIEPMYMALNVSKKEFVKMIDKKRFALPTEQELRKAIKKEAKHLYEICGRCSDWDSEERIHKLAKQYAKRKYGIDWGNDIETFVYFIKGYECPDVQRGCTYPKELVIGRGHTEYERITLVK